MRRIILLTVFVLLSGCSTIRETTYVVKENQRAVRASSEEIRHNTEIIAASSRVIAENSRNIEESSAMIERLKPDAGIGFAWIGFALFVLWTSPIAVAFLIAKTYSKQNV